MRSESSNFRKSELSISSRVYFAGMKLPTVMLKRMTMNANSVQASTLIFRCHSGSPARREARASRSAPAGGQVRRSRWPGTGRDASGVFSTMRAMCSIAARKRLGLRLRPGRDHQRQHQPARGRDFLVAARQAGQVGMRAGRRRRRPRSRHASSRRRPRRCRRPRTSRSRCSPTARSARRGRRGPAREWPRPAPCRSASVRSRSSFTQVAVSASACRAAAPAAAGTAKLAPSPPNTKGKSRSPQRVGHRHDHRGAGHVHGLVAVLGDGLGRLHHVGRADHPVAGQRLEQGRVHHLGEVAKQRQACVEVVGRGMRSSADSNASRVQHNGVMPARFAQQNATYPRSILAIIIAAASLIEGVVLSGVG